MLNESAKVWANTLSEREREARRHLYCDKQPATGACELYVHCTNVHTSHTFKENKCNFNSDCLVFKILLKFGDGDCFCDHLEVEMCVQLKLYHALGLVLHV